MIETCVTGDELTENRFISAQASRKNEKDGETHRFHFGYGGFHIMNTFMKGSANVWSVGDIVLTNPFKDGIIYDANVISVVKSAAAPPTTPAPPPVPIGAMATPPIAPPVAPPAPIAAASTDLRAPAAAAHPASCTSTTSITRRLEMMSDKVNEEFFKSIMITDKKRKCEKPAGAPATTAPPPRRLRTRQPPPRRLRTRQPPPRRLRPRHPHQEDCEHGSPHQEDCEHGSPHQEDCEHGSPHQEACNHAQSAG
ncbi:atherin-like [Bolinopsis microptera]|uniref:atherin-like n=1 Tax=Bolinopsis microptera TaxID=2820187 RepID=UPI00307AFA7B